MPVIFDNFEKLGLIAFIVRRWLRRHEVFSIVLHLNSVRESGVKTHSPKFSLNGIGKARHGSLRNIKMKVFT